MLLEKNLRRLTRLRSIVIAAEMVAVIFSILVFEVNLKLLPIAFVIGTQLAINLFTFLRLKNPRSVGENELFFQIAFDVVALTVVLHFSGGATNPFTLLYLLPISLTAATLPRAVTTWGMVGIAGLCYSVLLLLYVLVPSSHPHTLFGLHVFGMWTGFMASSGLIAFFAVSMNKVLRERDQVLAEAREKMLRDDRLVALGTLAAGAAHELGTPLATMQIISDDLICDFSHNSEIAEKARIISAQIKRCKESLSVLSASAGQSWVEAGRSMTLDVYLKQLVEEWHLSRPLAKVFCQWQALEDAPIIFAEQTLTHAIVNILNNAADASIDHIEVLGHWTRNDLKLEIVDRGEGLAPATNINAGKTLFTTKEKKGGLGLGLYLSYATIGRLGGNVELFNRKGGGTCTRVTLPLTKLLTVE